MGVAVLKVIFTFVWKRKNSHLIKIPNNGLLETNQCERYTMYAHSYTADT